MKIDPQDKAIQHIILLENMDDDSRKRIYEDAEKEYGSPWSLKLRDFFALMENDLSYLGIDKLYNTTVRQYAWIMDYRECAERVGELLKAFVVPQSPEAQRASQKCIKMSSKEAVMVFVRKYFNLPSFDAAMDIPLSDFIVAKKNEFNNSIFQYTMMQIQKQNFKKK